MRYLFLLAILILASCGGRSKAVVESVTPGQVVLFSDSLVDFRRADTIKFGRLGSGEKVSREFTVRNAGDKALVIVQVDLSCGCVSADYPMEPIMPGGEAPMTLTLDTKDLSGWVFKTVGVRSTYGSRPYTLCVTAEVE